jgi:membrane protein implicated in regulation of membrane protease activity
MLVPMNEGAEQGGRAWAWIRRLRRPDEFLVLVGVGLTAVLWLVLSQLTGHAALSLVASAAIVFVLGVIVWRRYDPMVISRRRKNAFRESRLAGREHVLEEASLSGRREG